RWEVERRRADDRLGGPRRLPRTHPDVVAGERGVEAAERGVGARALGGQAAQAPGGPPPPPGDADEGDLGEGVVPLDDLVGDPGERPVDRLAVEENLPGGDTRLAHGAGEVAGLRACSVIRNSFPASLDRA